MILVTGGTGFLGAYILKELIERGYAVRALRRSAKLPFFIDPALLHKVEWVDGDVLDVVALADAMKDVDHLVHAAALVSFAGSDHKRMQQINAEGTANVVNVALESGVRRLLHVSSVAALGRTRNDELVDESKSWANTSNNTAYARSKHAAEMEVWRGFSEGLEGVIINPSTLLGYGNWHQSSCALFRNGWNEFPWYTKGINGFAGVQDTARATVELLFSDINERRFIINAENWSFEQLLKTIADSLGKQGPRREATPFLGEIAWRLEAIKSVFTGRKPLLTRESALVAHSRTSFSNKALLDALPGFSFTPLETVIKEAGAAYRKAVNSGILAG